MSAIIRKPEQVIIKLLLMSVLLIPIFASASDYGENHYIGIGGGISELFDDADEATFKAQYQFAEWDNFWDLRPGFTFMLKDDSQYYISVGVERDWQINNDWSWGVGIDGGYFHKPGKLGYDVEFYSRIFVKYHLESEDQIRLELGHLSNSGFGDTNPGTEVLTLSYHWAL